MEVLNNLHKTTVSIFSEFFLNHRDGSDLSSQGAACQYYCDKNTSCISALPTTIDPVSSFVSDHAYQASWYIGVEILRMYTILGLLLLLSKYFFKIRQVSYASEVCLSFLTFLVISPVVIIGLVVNLILRSILTIYFNRVNAAGQLRLMSGNDAFWAYDEYANSCCFTALYVLQGRCDMSKIRQTFITNVMQKIVNGEEVYGVFGNRAVKKFGFYCWERAEKVDPSYHVRFITNPENAAQDEPMREEQVFEEIRKVYDYPLRSDRPQWEVLVVPNYVYNDAEMAGTRHYALVMRIHHSFMDGISAGFVLQNGLADYPPKLSVDPLAPLQIPLSRKILAYFGLVFLGPHSLFTTLTLNETNCFHGKALCGPKVLGWSKPVRLDALRNLKDATNTSTTAVLVSALGGSLRNLALRKHLQVPKVIHAFPTIAILPYPNSKPQNRFAVALFPMAIGLKSSKERLSSAYKSACDLARSPDVLFSYLTMKVTGMLPALATKFISDTAHATMLLTNVPGPSETAYLFGGDALVDVGVWAPVRSGIGIGMGLFSYNGRLRACMVGDASALPDSSDIPFLVEEFENEILDLSVQNNLPQEEVFFAEYNGNSKY